MKIQFINNWKYRANWDKLFDFTFKTDALNIKHILFGVFNFYLFIAWR